MGFLRRHKILSAAVLVLAILFVGVAVWFVVSFMPVPLVISKETTYITEPLRSDGTPDYVAALNQRLSKGVTPENNAAVLFWRAAGPGLIGTDRRAKYFQMLGIPPPPEKGDYFITPETWVERHKAKQDSVAVQPSAEVDDRLSKLLEPMSRPWSKKEFPSSAEWLAANEKPLALLVEGCNRSRRYDPLIFAKPDEGTLIQAPLPDPMQCREFAQSLVLRAMLRVKAGKVEEAWADLLACHRLARLVGQGPFVVEAVVAITIDVMAIKGDEALLQHVKLTGPQIAKVRHDLAGLPPMPRIADVMEKSERLTMLDFALSTRRQTPSVPGLDWNIVLRMINARYDRLAAAVSKPTRAERQGAIDEIGRDVMAEAAEAKSGKSPALLIVNRREAASRQVGSIVLSLLTPAEGIASTAEDRSTMEAELIKLAFALAEYRADRGRYPANLTTLVPKYLNEVPKDIFNNDADLHYSRKGDGYLLYSVGENGKDDGGKGRDDAKNGEGWDDLAVRMSAAKP